MASTRVVLPWSTWAIMAMLRIFWLMCGVAVELAAPRSETDVGGAKTKIAAGNNQQPGRISLFSGAVEQCTVYQTQRIAASKVVCYFPRNEILAPVMNGGS